MITDAVNCVTRYDEVMCEKASKHSVACIEKEVKENLEQVMAQLKLTYSLQTENYEIT